MRPFLTMTANRAVDDYAINSCGIPGVNLMGNAGEAVVKVMQSEGFLEKSPEILVLAGKGNNGGDGFVIATTLHKLGKAVSLLHVSSESELEGDALHHFKLAQNSGLNLAVWRGSRDQNNRILSAVVIVDALLGTGIQGELRTPFGDIIQAINLSSARVISVDVASGIYGDTGVVLDPCVAAECTVSIGYGKQSCLFEPARSHSGAIHIVDIGFPDDTLENVSGHVLGELEKFDFLPEKFNRYPDTHKYSAGKVFTIAGSKGFTGAAVLSAKSALRSGAGLVRLALPSSLGSIGESLSLETIIDYLPETNDQSFSSDGFQSLIAGCNWADTVAIGPGLGRHTDTLKLARDLIKSIERPLVIDADALFALVEHSEILKERTAPTILTPHLGEFKRLLGLESIADPPWISARKFAMDYGVYLLLKGAPSVLVTPEGVVSVNSTGHAGMATAGSGDVLTGLISSLWAQWQDMPDILNFAMYIHGHAADLNLPEKGILGMISSDIVEALPMALKEYGGLPN